ncbi:cytochrome-c peroxidase [Pontibacter actiniarum]|uniref:Cytochrome c domain-containing protein n=1 Tax=Pontibacter actiniarum TaxID=323450 RepID=A0A1X9YMJ1_9BACT|nr:cytochrome c peroxidase [Pontibacter actiniarum]ARS34077.1 hypothetical protein CA264_00715 [Pontibacter actiniarum]
MATNKYALFFILAFSTLSCSSDEGSPAIEPDTPTPYALTIPKHLPQNYTLPADNPLTEEGVELGRHLFYEEKLSGNNTMSCGSCHQQEKAFTDGRALSLGIDGLPSRRSAMSLANMLWFSQLNWDGSALSLEEQARGPIENTVELHENLGSAVAELQAASPYPRMFQKAFGDSIITETNVLKALAQFERTLISADSRYDRYMNNQEQLTKDELEGMKLFLTHPDPSTNTRGGNCGDCHGGTLFSLRTFHNNGLDDTFSDNGLGDVTGLERDKGKFKAPTMRNIALTAPYMHDGRFATLEEVLDHYNDHIKYNSPTLDPLIIEASNEPNGKTLLLTAEEKRKIIAFLHTLTDPTFTTDKRFSDPNK